jgi:hypothetical protein
MMLMPPTVSALTDIASHPDVAAILAAADSRDVVRILPKLIVDEADRLRFLLPHDPDYPREPAT